MTTPGADTADTAGPAAPTPAPAAAQAPGPDRTLAFVRRGYPYLASLRAGHLAAPLRLLGRPAVAVGGREGAELFYDTDRMRRRGAMPAPVRSVLFGRGAVHGLDGEAHRVRKAMFLAIARPAAVEELAADVVRRLDAVVPAWTGRGEVPVFDELVRVFGAAVLRWGGVPAPRDRIDTWSADLALIVDGFGGVGPRHVRARRARRRSERWARAAVRDTRAGRIQPPPGSALDAVARHVGPGGRRLPVRTAAVELLNVLRPTIAVAWYGEFVVLGLLQVPQWRGRLAAGDGAALEAFVHEVRRVYPFVPALAARARTGLVWNGVRIAPGTRVVLDVHGTDHDPRSWPDPGQFRPGRFLGRAVDPFAYVPQGGGDPATGHRCPGERIAVELLAAVTRRLAAPDVVLPERAPDVVLSRMPTRPGVTVVRAAGVRGAAAGRPDSAGRATS